MKFNKQFKKEEKMISRKELESYGIIMTDEQ
jgi:hypothetical protein